MKVALIIFGLIVISLILKACVQVNNDYKNPSRPVTAQLPNKVENDKIVVIKGAPYSDIHKAIKQYCNSYNQEGYVAIPNLTKVTDSLFLVTFPYDISFVNFCYFVNYLYYPNDIFYKADIKAWVTTSLRDDWITEKSANKKVMLYIPSDSKEYDNVYLTTPDNIGYKLGFAVGEEKQLLALPKLKYIEPTFTIDIIKDNPTEEIK